MAIVSVAGDDTYVFRRESRFLECHHGAPSALVVVTEIAGYTGHWLTFPGVVVMLTLKSTATATDAPSFIAIVRHTPLSSFCMVPTLVKPASSTRLRAWFSVKLLAPSKGAASSTPVLAGVS